MVENSSVRHMCSEVVSIACTGKAGPARPLCGNLEEIGEWSAVVLTDVPIPRRTRVAITCETHRLKGFVRSCTRDRVLGYFIEVRLDQDSQWSQKWFTPHHLLMLCGNLRSKVFHPKVA
jgi:hypothetical protein